MPGARCLWTKPWIDVLFGRSIFPMTVLPECRPTMAMTCIRGLRLASASAVRLSLCLFLGLPPSWNQTNSAGSRRGGNSSRADARIRRVTSWSMPLLTPRRRPNSLDETGRGPPVQMNRACFHCCSVRWERNITVSTLIENDLRYRGHQYWRSLSVARLGLARSFQAHLGQWTPRPWGQKASMNQRAAAVSSGVSAQNWRSVSPSSRASS